MPEIHSGYYRNVSGREIDGHKPGAIFLYKADAKTIGVLVDIGLITPAKPENQEGVQ